jgi:hypothetical protein
MSTDVTMQELELETAELLPARETLTRCGCQSYGGSEGGFALVNVSGNNVASGNSVAINAFNIGLSGAKSGPASALAF